MIQTIKDYSKSVITNKVTLTGYLIIPVLPFIDKIEVLTGFHLSMPLCFLSTGLLTSTQLGYNTFKKYVNTKSEITKTGTIDLETIETYNIDELCYGNRKGVQLAAKENNLEHLLTKEHYKKLLIEHN